ncbi:pro-resilin-like [Musca vetustissima]|uniref:pro-resilin-like n=1 Tax=Musca vetustissima TaxID=27455 RepID=UPI002AB7D175|nr:pro-resilin-like [Musca vetustissima]
MLAAGSELGYDYNPPAFGFPAGGGGGGFGNSFGNDGFAGNAFGGGFGGVPSNTYIPPAAVSISVPVSTYLPPAPAPAPAFQSIPVPSNTYIPPAVGGSFGGGGGAISATAFVTADVGNSLVPPVADFGIGLGNDGYRYKTIRRRVYRRRV